MMFEDFSISTKEKDTVQDAFSQQGKSLQLEETDAEPEKVRSGVIKKPQFSLLIMGRMSLSPQPRG